ncbi:MAG: hypothetical protein QM758_13735 [Armatimonas sp.]
MSNRPQLLGVTRVEVPLKVIEETIAHLQKVGLHGYEGITLWVGIQQGETFNVRANVVPAQTVYRSEEGVGVHVDSEELHRINVWLYQSGFRIIAQVHSHPEDAYHSTTDDDYAIAAASGSLSLVVPDFGFRTFTLADCAVYRLMSETGWTYLSQGNVEQLIVIVDDEIGSTVELRREAPTKDVDRDQKLEKVGMPWHSRISWIRRLWPHRTS